MLARFTRPFVRQVARLEAPSLFRTSLHRGFATGPTSAETEKAERKLVKILTKEIEYEEDNYQEDQSVKQYLQSHKWVLQEKEDSNLLVLKKVSGNSVVQVYFTASAPSFEENEENDEEGQKKEANAEEEGEGDQPNILDFNIYISQGKKTMALECSSVGGEIEVNSCNIVDDINVHRSMLPFGTAATESYKGPDFGQLDESLQESIFNLLRSHGITPELADLIEHMATDKEQRLYMRWLKQVKDFVTQN
jgi:complement component 1 Q subcomponent-binding protein